MSGAVPSDTVESMVRKYRDLLTLRDWSGLIRIFSHERRYVTVSGEERGEGCRLGGREQTSVLCIPCQLEKLKLPGSSAIAMPR